ncbi:hypothetical protein VTK56DRAFT_8529 [Thermocarpiscus australiensis]
MCTYDYTPYSGCKGGQQHFYIQWMRCNKALASNKYCPREKSTEVKELQKLSANVLSCPIHGPIAVQQHLFDFIQAETLDELRESTLRGQDEELVRPRVRTTARRGNLDTTTKSRAPNGGTLSRRSEHHMRNEARRCRSIRDPPPSPSDSEWSTTSPLHHRATDGADTLDLPHLAERRHSSTACQRPHRRGRSADLGLPPPLSLSIHHRHSDVALPLRVEGDTEAVGAQETTNQDKQPRPKTAITIPDFPVGQLMVGLPSRPDILRRPSAVHRSRSEGLLLRQGKESPLGEAAEPAGWSPVSSSDGSPTSPAPNSEPGPFSNACSRRGRRVAAPRASSHRSGELAMGRIEESAAPEEENDDDGTNTQTTYSPTSAASGSPMVPVPSPERQRYGWDVPHPSIARRTSHASSLAGRESVDSGYRSGHAQQQPPGSRQVKKPGEGVASAAVGDGAGTDGRGYQQAPALGQGQGHGSRQLPTTQAPLGLGLLPPSTPPVSVSPGLQPASDLNLGKEGKVSLLHKLGLRKKISGLMGNRGGQRDVGAFGG